MIIEKNSTIFNRAKEGDVNAQYVLATAHGVEGNTQERQNLLTKAAEQGHVLAAQELEAETGIVIEPPTAE